MSETTDVQHKITIRAQALLEQLHQRDFRHANSHFDTMMTSLMPPEKIEEAWNLVTESIGPFVETQGTRLENANGFDIVVLTSKFEKATIDTVVAFDSAHNIAGLSFAPSGKSANKSEEETQPMPAQDAQPVA